MIFVRFSGHQGSQGRISRSRSVFSYTIYTRAQTIGRVMPQRTNQFYPTPRTWHQLNLYHWKKFGVHGRNSKIESFKFQVIRKITSQKKFRPCAVNAICTRHLRDSHAAQRHSPMFHAIFVRDFMKSTNKIFN